MSYKIILAAFILSFSNQAFAKKNCTDLPKSSWMKEADFKKKLEGEGYKIRKFKQSGSCYEIYGTDKMGQKVEIYFNPVDGSIVKKEEEKN